MTSHDFQQWSGSRFAKGGCTLGDEKKGVSISVSDAARVTIEPGRHASSRVIPQGLPAVIDGLETWRRIEA